MIDLSLPGADLVAKGLRDASRGEVTVESLLVNIGAPRLRRLGIAVDDLAGLAIAPETALYLRLGEEQDDLSAHSRYNALIRRLVSFESALEHAASRAARASAPPKPE